MKTIDLGGGFIVTIQEENDPEPTAPVDPWEEPADPREKKARETLQSFFEIIRQIGTDLEKIASDKTQQERFREALEQIGIDPDVIAGNNYQLPHDWEHQLKEKIISGFFDWAIRRMGSDFTRYLEAGRANFMDHFKVLFGNPSRTEPSTRFDEAFRRAEFFIPVDFERTKLRHDKWLELYQAYETALSKAQEIKKGTAGDPQARAFELKKAFPNVTGKMVKRQPVQKPEEMSPDDVAATYVWKTFKPGVGPETLKKCFKAFRDKRDSFDPGWGYFDHIVKHLNATRRGE